MTPSTDLRALGPMARLGEGAYGVVYRLERFALPGCGPLAYKEFKAPLDDVRAANLTALVEARAAMSPRDRHLVDAATCWPLRLVRDRSQLAGFVMPLLDDAFSDDVRLPSGAVQRAPRTAQWLVTDEARTAAADVAVPAAEDLPNRLVLCAKLAHTLGVLHRHGLVYGDLSLNNVLYAFGRGSAPRVVLVDCDGVRAASSAGMAQENSPDWTPPELTDGSRSEQDEATDCYKLALFVLRCCAPGELASVSTDADRVAGVLDDAGLDMLRAGLGSNRAARPSAKDWYLYLARVARQLTEPPVLHEVTLDRAVAMRGGTVTVTWRSTGATRVDIAGPDGHLWASGPWVAAHAVTLTVLTPGAITVTVSNLHGRARGATAPVAVLEPPRIAHVRLPEPAVPTLCGPELVELGQRVSGALAATGRAATVVLPELPTLAVLPELPPLADLLDTSALTEALLGLQPDPAVLLAGAAATHSDPASREGALR